MSANSSSVVSRPRVLTESWNVVSDGRRLRAEHAGGDLHVLLANRANDVGRRQPARRQPIGIEPDAHAVLAGAEHLRAAHAGDARQLVLHPQVGEVREIQLVVAAVGRDEVHDHDEVRRGLLGHDADALHLGRQPRQRLRHAVLHLHLRVVEVGAEREGDGQRHPAVGCRLREHVEHVLDAVDLLLERRGHGLGDDLRVRARIGGAHDDGRRHHLRVLADRQPEERQRSGHDDHQRQHGGEDRTIDEELREFHDELIHRLDHGSDLHAGPHALQTIDDDRLAGLETAANDAQAIDDRTERHGAVLDVVLRPDDVDELLAEIGADGAVLNQQPLYVPRAGQTQPHEEARRQLSVGVAEHRPRRESCRSRHRAGCRGSPGDPARGKPSSLASAMRIGRSVERGATARPWAAASRGVPEEDLLVGVEVGVDGIERHDGGEQRGLARPARHQVALGDDRAADAAVDRRRDLRELEVQLRGPERGLDGRRLRRRFLRECRAAIVLLVRDRVLGAKALGALQLGVGALTRGSRARELGAQTIDLRLERPRIDLEQQVASLDDGALPRSGPPRRDPIRAAGLSTESTACSRPVNSSHSVTSRSMTWATVTCGGGGGPCCAAVCEQPAATIVNASDAKSVGFIRSQCVCHAGGEQSGSGRRSSYHVSISSAPDVSRMPDYDFWTMCTLGHAGISSSPGKLLNNGKCQGKEEMEHQMESPSGALVTEPVGCGVASEAARSSLDAARRGLAACGADTRDD